MILGQVIDRGLYFRQASKEPRLYELQLFGIQQARAGWRELVGRGRSEARVAQLQLDKRLLQSPYLRPQTPAPLRLLVLVVFPRAWCSHVQGGGHLTRIDPCFVGRSRRVRDDRPDGRRAPRPGGHESTAPLLAYDNPVLLKPLVDRANGVGVHAERVGEVAQPGETVSGTEPAIPYTSPQSPRKLHSNWNVGVAIDLDVELL
jgi:hypothetical protein